MHSANNRKTGWQKAFIPEAAFLLACTAVFITPFAGNGLAHESWLLKTSFACSLLCISLLILSAGFKGLVVRKSILAFLLICLYSSMTAFFAHVPAYCLQFIMELSILPLTAMCFCFFPDRHKLLNKLLFLQGISLIVLHFLSGYLALKEYVFFYNKNFLAIYLLIVALRLSSEREFRNQGVVLAVFAVFLPALSVQICAGTILTILLLSHCFRLKIRKALAITLSSLLVTCLFLVLMVKQIPERSSWDHRLVMWKAALNMFSETPVTGKGAGNYIVHYPRFSSQPSGNYNLALFAHNDFLEVLAELGAAGFILYLLYLWLLLKEFREKDLPLLGGILIIACFSMPLHMACVQMVAGLSLAKSWSSKDFKEKNIPRFCLTTSIFSIILFSVSAMFLISTYHYRTGVILGKSKPLLSMRYLKKSIEEKPFYSAAMLELSRIMARENLLNHSLALLEKTYALEPYIVDRKAIRNRKLLLDAIKDQVQEKLMNEKGNSMAHFYLAELYMSLGELEKAESLYVSFLNEHPDHAAAIYRLSVIYAFTDQYRKACKLLSL